MKRGMPSGAQTPDGIIFLLALIFSKAPPRYPPHHGAHWAYTVVIPLIGEKNGTKRNILVDERGVLLSIVVTGANRHDVTQIEAVLKNRVRKPRGRTHQNLCADAGYSGKNSEEVMRKYHYVPHVRARGDEKRAIQQGYKAKRWIVEVAHSWLNRFRKLLVRFEKTNASYEALLHLAASIIAFRKIGVI